MLFTQTPNFSFGFSVTVSFRSWRLENGLKLTWPVWRSMLITSWISTWHRKGWWMSWRVGKYTGSKRWQLTLSWWRHQMETFSALLAICAGNPPVRGEFPAQRPVTQSYGVFFDLRLNKRLSKQPWGWWFETLLWSLWRHRNGKLLPGLTWWQQPVLSLSYEIWPPINWLASPFWD